MDKLKLRLEPLKLSDEQKEKMLTQPLHSKKQFTFIPIIIPTFFAVALLFIVLTIMPSEVNMTTASFPMFNSEPLPIRYIVITSVSTLMMITVYILMRKTIAETKRWQQNAFLQEVYAVLVKLSFMIPVLMIVAAIMWIGLFYFSNRWYAEGVYMFWVYGLLMFSYLYPVRHFERTVCPHCSAKFTRWEIIVKSAMQYRERCNSCKQLVYLTKQSKQNAIVLFFWPMMPLWMGNFASVYEGIIIACSVLSILTFIAIYIPIMAEFTKEDTDPEKLA